MTTARQVLYLLLVATVNAVAWTLMRLALA